LAWIIDLSFSCWGLCRNWFQYVIMVCFIIGLRTRSWSTLLSICDSYTCVWSKSFKFLAYNSHPHTLYHVLMLIYLIVAKRKWEIFCVVCKFHNPKWLWKKVLENLKRCFSQDAIACHGSLENGLLVISLFGYNNWI
jgi:hypothetical protein